MNDNSLVSQIVDHGIDALGRHYSVYRAVVVDIDDDLHMDRIKVFIPELNVMEWALPKGQHGSHNCGVRLFPIPGFNEVVYVTFEDGNPSQPLWEYHSWAPDQQPDEFLDPDTCGIITPGGTKVLINDKFGDVSISTTHNILLTVQGQNNEGIILNADKIRLMSNLAVVVNEGYQGVIKINELTQKLNNLVQELEQLKTLYNTHTHPGVMSGSAVSDPTAQQAAKPFSQFNKTDYEDKTFLH